MTRALTRDGSFVSNEVFNDRVYLGFTFWILPLFILSRLAIFRIDKPFFPLIWATTSFLFAVSIINSSRFFPGQLFFKYFSRNSLPSSIVHSTSSIMSRNSFWSKSSDKHMNSLIASCRFVEIMDRINAVSTFFDSGLSGDIPLSHLLVKIIFPSLRLLLSNLGYDKLP